MNSKTKIYILIIAVIGIWGYIGYKIISKLNPDTPEYTNEESTVSFNPKHTVKIDTFSIRNVPKDPFLGTLTKKKTKGNSSKNLNSKKVTSSRAIIYKGLIKKQDSKNKVFILDINNKQYLLKKNQVADSVKLIKGNAKEIVIRFNNKTQTISIK